MSLTLDHYIRLVLGGVIAVCSTSSFASDPVLGKYIHMVGGLAGVLLMGVSLVDNAASAAQPVAQPVAPPAGSAK